MDDLVIELFIGRDPQDLIDLAAKHQHLYQRNLSTVTTKVRSKDLVRALEIVSEQNRPNFEVPVDMELIQRDVMKIIPILQASFPRAEDLFELFLRRSNRHIQFLSIMYEQQSKEPLDTAIRKSGLSQIARDVCIHAVRTATNMTYRDAMLLRNALLTVGTKKGKLAIAIRVIRMQFYKRHWMQIKAEFVGVTGIDFRSKMNNLSEGVFRDLMSAMARV